MTLMSDMNEYTGYLGGLHAFCVEDNLVDTVVLLNPEIEADLIYIYKSKRIDYIFSTHLFAEIAIKSGNHHFQQHIISDHRVFTYTLEQMTFLIQTLWIKVIYLIEY